MYSINQFSHTSSLKSKNLLRSKHKIKICDSNELRTTKKECASQRINDLARPNLRRIKSIFEKQRKKSKFDMIRAEKLLTLMNEKTQKPWEVKRCIDELVTVRKINNKNAIKLDRDNETKERWPLRMSTLKKYELNSTKLPDISQDCKFENNKINLNASSQHDPNERFLKERCKIINEYEQKIRYLNTKCKDSDDRFRRLYLSRPTKVRQRGFKDHCDINQDPPLDVSQNNSFWSDWNEIEECKNYTQIEEEVDMLKRNIGIRNKNCDKRLNSFNENDATQYADDEATNNIKHLKRTLVEQCQSPNSNTDENFKNNSDTAKMSDFMSKDESTRTENILDPTIHSTINCHEDPLSVSTDFYDQINQREKNPSSILTDISDYSLEETPDKIVQQSIEQNFTKETTSGDRNIIHSTKLVNDSSILADTLEEISDQGALEPTEQNFSKKTTTGDQNFKNLMTHASVNSKLTEEYKNVALPNPKNLLNDKKISALPKNSITQEFQNHKKNSIAPTQHLKIMNKKYVDTQHTSLNRQSTLDTAVKTTNFNSLFVNDKHIPSKDTSILPVIALREFRNDLGDYDEENDILIRVTKSDFDKIYVIRKIDDKANLEEFCKNPISSRSKLFLLGSRENDKIEIKRLNLNHMKTLCGEKHESSIVDFSNNHLLENINHENFTVRRVSMNSTNLFKFGKDVKVVQHSKNKSNFVVSKKKT